MVWYNVVVKADDETGTGFTSWMEAGSYMHEGCLLLLIAIGEDQWKKDWVLQRTMMRLGRHCSSLTAGLGYGMSWRVMLRMTLAR